MVNRNYNKGRSFEYRVQKYLEKLGYLVFRHAGSHFPDLIAVKGFEFCIIECKTGSGRMSLKDKNTMGLFKLKCPSIKCFLAQNVKRKIVFSEIA